jgi:hypothetical protein
MAARIDSRIPGVRLCAGVIYLLAAGFTSKTEAG